MRITFVLPSVRINGGNRVVLEFGNQLQARGHELTVVHPALGYPLGGQRAGFKEAIYRRARNTAANLLAGDLHRWFTPTFAVRRVAWVAPSRLPEADITLASAWPTAFTVARAGPQQGRKAYFIQNYETWSGTKAKVDASYRLPLAPVALAGWLADLVRTHFQRDPVYEFFPGIRLDQFYNSSKTYNRPARVLMQYSPLSWKGIADGLAAVALARDRYPELRLVLFGLRRGADVPPDVEFHQNPDRESLRQLYAASDVFLCPSWFEGWGLPAMEAMACRCAVVTTNVGGVPRYTVPGETALVVPPRQPEQLAEALKSLLGHPERLASVTEAGHRNIQAFGWEAATDALERTLLEITSAPGVPA